MQVNSSSQVPLVSRLHDAMYSYEKFFVTRRTDITSDEMALMSGPISSYNEQTNQEQPRIE